MDFLEKVEEYLRTRGKPVEKRGHLNCVAFLAFNLQIAAEDFESFKAALLAQADKPRPVLDVLADGETINYIGIPQTKQERVESPTPEVARSPEALALEEMQAHFYLLQFELVQSKLAARSAKEERDAAVAEARDFKSQLNQTKAELAAANEKLAATANLRATAEQLASLTTEHDGLKRAIVNKANEAAAALKRANETDAVLAKFRQAKDDHACQVSGLHKLFDAPCGCIVIADHRRCDESRVLIVEPTNERMVNLRFTDARSNLAKPLYDLAAEVARGQTPFIPPGTKKWERSNRELRRAVKARMEGHTPGPKQYQLFVSTYTIQAE